MNTQKTKKVSTAIEVKKFFGMSTQDMKNEWSQLSNAEKLEFSDMLAAIGIVVTDRANYATSA